MCSLYPSVMLGVDKLGFECVYPIGLPKPTNMFMHDKIGFYEVDIHYQLPHIKNVIPWWYYKSQKIENGLTLVEFDNER